MKKCNSCGDTKPSEEFHKKGKGLAPMCKPCTKTYRAQKYVLWTEDQKANLREKNLERKEKNTRLLREYKTSRPCSDCGGFFHFSAMDFDHLDDTKFKDVSRLVSHGSWSKILAEIAKCDLVCANCHRVRTYGRRSGTLVV